MNKNRLYFICMLLVVVGGVSQMMGTHKDTAAGGMPYIYLGLASWIICGVLILIDCRRSKSKQ